MKAQIQAGFGEHERVGATGPDALAVESLQVVEEQPAEGAPAENAANTAEADFVCVLANDWGFSSEEAHAVYAVLSDVGFGYIKMTDGRMAEGASLDAIRGMAGSHQANFTANNKPDRVQEAPAPGARGVGRRRGIAQEANARLKEEYNAPKKAGKCVDAAKAAVASELAC